MKIKPFGLLSTSLSAATNMPSLRDFLFAVDVFSLLVANRQTIKQHQPPYAIGYS
jgi:hypothetical protein